MTKTTKSLFFISVILNAMFFTVAALEVKNRYFVKPASPIQNHKSDNEIIKEWQNVYTLNRQKYQAELPINNQDNVFIGDSHIQCFELSEMLHSLSFKNRGISGDHSFGVLNRLGPILAGHPKRIFIMIGVNDIYDGLSTNKTGYYMGRIIDKIKSESPQSQLFINSVLPANFDKIGSNIDPKDSIVAINKITQQICADKNVTFINLYPYFSKNGHLNPLYDCGDHLHLNYAGYSLWKSHLKKYL